MSDFERETRTTTTTTDPASVRETTTVRDPDTTTYVRTGNSATPWIIAAIVAIVAIIAVAYLMTSRGEPTTNTDNLAAAMDASRAAGYVEGATTAMDSSIPTTVQVPVPVPMPSFDTGAAERSAADAADAARDARDAAERAADSAASTLDPDTSVSSNSTQ